MKDFDKLPKSIKKTIRYINQDVNSLYKLDEIEKQLITQIEKKREELKSKR